MRSDQLSYPAAGSPLTDLNRRPLPYHGSALPTELRGRADHPERSREEPGKTSNRDPVRYRPEPCRPPSEPPNRADAEAIRAIYNAEVAGSTVTFDLVPRSLEDQVAWIEEHSGGHPAIVAVDDVGAIVGLRIAVAVQGATGVLHHRRGLGLRARRPPRHRRRTSAARRARPARAAVRVPLGDRPDRRRSRRVDHAAPPVRVRDRRHRARGRPEARYAGSTSWSCNTCSDGSYVVRHAGRHRCQSRVRVRHRHHPARRRPPRRGRRDGVDDRRRRRRDEGARRRALRAQAIGARRHDVLHQHVPRRRTAARSASRPTSPATSP